MRNDQEFLAEIYSREAKYIKCKKKITQGVLLSIIPLFICASIVAAVSIMPLMTKSAPSANKSPATEKYETLTDNEGTIDAVADEGVVSQSQEETLQSNNYSSSADINSSEQSFKDVAPSVPSVNSTTKGSSPSTTVKPERIPLPNNKSDTKNLIELTKNQPEINAEFKWVDNTFATANTEFYLNLLKQLNEKDQNTVFSPLSLINVLGMTANGAGGKTLKEIEKVIAGGMDISEFNKYIADYADYKYRREDGLTLANSIWITNDNSIKAKNTFLGQCKGIYKSQVFKTDFNDVGVAQINGWVSKYTNGKITKIIDGFQGSEAMILTNALHFEDTWSRPFKEENVRTEKFTNSNGKRVNVSMMYSQEPDYLSGKNCTGFIKDYYKSESFVALLPKEGMSTEEFLTTLTATDLQEILKSNEINYEYEVKIELPKFTVDYNTSLKSTLKNLGIKTAFSKSEADFSAMADSKANLYVADVLHSTTIEVNEKGTVATAGTVSIVANKGSPDKIKEVILNRPFVYFIIDNSTKLPIFCGTINHLPAVD